MDLTLSTAAILAFVPAMSLFANVRFNHNENIKSIKRHQRDSLRAYSVGLIGTLWKYADLEVRYLNERLIIQEKLAADEEVDETFSKFVYQMKDELLSLQTELRRKIWNSQIEISKHDFPKLRNRVAKSFLAINVYTKPFELENYENLDLLKIKVLEQNLAREIKELTKDFGKQTDQLSLEIKNTNIYHDLKHLFLKLSRLDTKKNRRQTNDSAKKVFGEAELKSPGIAEFLAENREFDEK
jgi:hypothetical protein